VNPFLPLIRIATAVLRWRPRPAQEIPVERPPRRQRPGRRTRVLWNANQIHPYAVTVDEPEAEHYWTR